MNLKLQSQNILTGEHTGGCVLFEQKEKVEKILCENKQYINKDEQGEKQQ